MTGWRRVARRLAQVASVLGMDQQFGSTRKSVTAGVRAAFGEITPGSSYLVLAALESKIPLGSAIEFLERERRLERRCESIVALAASAARRLAVGIDIPLLIIDGVTVDVTDTSGSPFTTGIQRVARETVSRWTRDHEVTTVAWDSSRTRLRAVGLDGRRLADGIVVPFSGAFVLPEIAVDEPRALRLAAIALHSRVRSVAIGFDCIPLTTAEVSGPGMPGAFAKYLAALSGFSAIAAISHAATAEYKGWRRMLGGTGLSGPDVVTIGLAFDPGTASGELARAAREELKVPDGDLVLAVGSHEPRKNHLRLLSAAEEVWESGIEFSLVIVGGNSWQSEEFSAAVTRLQSRGLPVITASRAPDAIVWGLYAAATVSVFPSLNEGFGLPIVESLALGTPVITSNFGSMREVGAGYGALLVDPRSAREIAVALRSALEDRALQARLRAEASRLPARSWGDYAAELWALVSEPREAQPA